jgi:membrane fusion protein (multidrug efflux system)
MKRSAHILILIPSLLIAACGGGGASNPEAELARLKKERAAIDEKIAALENSTRDTSAQKATPVSVITLQPSRFRAYVEVQAQVTGDDNVNATPQMQGVVKSVLVRAGQRVSKGQVLALLDAAAVEQQIQAQEAQLTLAKALYEKQQQLWEQQIGTEVQLLQAKASYESLLKQRDASVAQRNMFRVVSPISGVVDLVNMKEGDASMPGSPVSFIRVVNSDKLRVEANLGENYLGKVKAGDPVLLVFPDLGDSIRTKLTYVSRAVDPISRAFMVQVHLGGNKNLHPNMSCRMQIYNYEQENALAVPVSIIQKTAQGEMLYVADGNKAKAVIVTTGRISNGITEVTSGLNPGDQVITEGYEELDNGEPIVIEQ